MTPLAACNPYRLRRRATSDRLRVAPVPRELLPDTQSQHRKAHLMPQKWNNVVPIDRAGVKPHDGVRKPGRQRRGYAQSPGLPVAGVAVQALQGCTVRTPPEIVI